MVGLYTVPWPTLRKIFNIFGRFFWYLFETFYTVPWPTLRKIFGIY